MLVRLLYASRVAESLTPELIEGIWPRRAQPIQRLA